MATGGDSTPQDNRFKRRRIATGEDLTLTDTQIEDLAQIIVSKHMATIAIKYLEIPYETVENLKRDSKDSIAFNRDLLVQWRNKNPGINQIQVSKKQSSMVFDIYMCMYASFN